MPSRRTMVNGIWMSAALALGGCRKPSPPPEPPPIETRPTAGESELPAEAASSGSSSAPP